ncbi:MAG: hypothetical protein KGZ87_05330 [Bacteroidetes bacterium]|nr:hypothetical protein [Bacteroidota bacterium]
MNHILTNPKGIDAVIQKIQMYLFDNLNWGEIEVYGRVYKNQSKDKKDVPEAYIGKNEYKDVLINDTKNGSIFFIEGPKHNSKEGIRFTNTVKIVFMLNLQKIYPESVHRADMEAQMKAIELIRKKTWFSFEKMEKGIKESLDDFYTENLKGYDEHPFHVFSISGEITYNVSCLTN